MVKLPRIRPRACRKAWILPCHQAMRMWSPRALESRDATSCCGSSVVICVLKVKGIAQGLEREPGAHTAFRINARMQGAWAKHWGVGFCPRRVTSRCAG